MKTYILLFSALVFVILTIPGFAFADVAPMPQFSCQECAEYCVGCCGQKPTNPYGCSECRYLNCNYEEVCMASDACAARRAQEELAILEAAANENAGDAKQPTQPGNDTSKAATRPQERSCAASPMPSTTHSWSLLLILIAVLGIFSFGAVCRVNRKKSRQA